MNKQNVEGLTTPRHKVKIKKHIIKYVWSKKS